MLGKTSTPSPPSSVRARSTGTAGTASGITRLTPELRPSAGNSLFVFALPRRPTAVQA